MKRKLLALLLSVSMLAAEAGYADISVLAEGVKTQTDQYEVVSASEGGIAITPGEVTSNEAKLNVTAITREKGTIEYSLYQAASEGEATPGESKFEEIAKTVVEMKETTGGEVTDGAGTATDGAGTQALADEAALPELELKDGEYVGTAKDLVQNTTYWFMARVSVSTDRKIFKTDAVKVKTTPTAALQALMDKLAATIKRAQGVQQADYLEEQWEALQNAIAAGEAWLLAEGDTTNEISAAEGALSKAIDMTKGEGDESGDNKDVDKTALEAAIAAAEAAIKDKDVNGFVTSVWNAFPDAIKAAKAVNDNKNATQDEVDKAAADLQAATADLADNALSEDAAAAKKALADAITAANTKVKDVTEPAVAVAAFKEAIATAQKAYDEDAKGAAASYYTDAANALATADTVFDNALKDEAKAALKAVIDNANEVVKNENATDESKAALNAAITKAQGVYDAEASTIADYNNAAKELKDAIAAFIATLPIQAIEASAQAESDHIYVNFSGVNGATAYTVERATGTGAFEKLADVALTTEKEGTSFYTADFTEIGNTQGFANLTGENCVNTDGYLNVNTGTKSGARAAGLNMENPASGDIVKAEFDVKFDATGAYSNNTPAVSLTGAALPTTNDLAKVTGQILTITVASATTDGNRAVNAWESVAVNGTDITATALKDGIADWMKVSATLNFTTKKADVVITGVADGAEIYSGTLDFVDNTVSSVMGIYVQAGRGSAGNYLDNIAIYTSSAFSFNDTNITDKTEYSYKITTTVNGKNYCSNIAKATADFASANRAGLREAIAAAEALKESDYTAASWSVLKEALATAKTVLAKADATQAEVDEAAKAVTDAINALVKGTPDGSESSENSSQVSSEPGSQNPGTTKPKKNDTFTIGKVSYKVLSATTVSFVKTADTSKNLTVKIPDTVKTPKGKYTTQHTMKVTTIADKAFRNKKNIKTVVIGNNVTTIGKNAFEKCSVQKVTIGTRVKTISASAFASATKLTTVTVKSKVLAKVDTKAFYGCTKLKSITLPDSVTTIGASAFQKCSILGTVKIGSNAAKAKLTSIGKNAFASDKKLKTIKIASKKLKKNKIAANAFKGINKQAKIYVFNKSLKTYKKSVFTKKTGFKSPMKLIGAKKF